MKVNITIIKPDRVDEVLTLSQPTEITVGRSPNCTLSLEFDAMVSRMHAVLLVDPPSIRIKDLNSTNGMIINGEAYGGVNHEKLFHPQELRDGDTVMIGTTALMIEVAADAGDGKDDPDKTPGSESTVIGIDKTQLFRRQRMPAGGDTWSGMTADFPEVPGYTLQKCLGSGRNGNVYRAVSTAGDKVAVKVILPEVAFTKKMLDAFSHELDRAKAVDHPHIVKLLDSGAIGEKCIYLVLEYVSGEDLSSYLLRCPDRRIPLRAAYNLMLQIASALAYSHGHDFLHRDLRPQSILLTDDNSRLLARTTDVGLAKCFEDSGIFQPSGAFASGEATGYAAPEQMPGLRAARPAEDVFSAGAIFYQMLTGSVPRDFGSGGKDRPGKASRDETVPPDTRLPGLPDPLADIIGRALSADPDNRYRNGEDLLDALERVRL